MSVHKTYLYLLASFTYFYNIFDVGKEKILVNGFLLLLVFECHFVSTYYFYKQENKDVFTIK